MDAAAVAPPPSPADLGDFGFAKVPLAFLRALVAGEFTAGEVRAALAVAKGAPWYTHGRQVRPPIATRPWILRHARVSARTLYSAVHGTPGRDRLRYFLHETRGRFEFNNLDRFARVTLAEVEAILRQAVPLDALRLWAWSALRLSGPRRLVREVFDATLAAKALGWAPGRVWRALRGAADRPGAVDLGIVRFAAGWLYAWLPRRRAICPTRAKDPRETAERAEMRERMAGLAAKTPLRKPVENLVNLAVDTRSMVADRLSRARVEIPWYQIVSGERSLLVDLAAEWLARKGRGEIEASTKGALVAPLSDHLAEVRDIYPRQRWAPRILYRLLGLLLDRPGQPGTTSPDRAPRDSSLDAGTKIGGQRDGPHGANAGDMYLGAGDLDP